MNSKTSYTLCSLSSLTNSKNLPEACFNPNITERLYLARQKLLPVIDDLMKSAAKNSSGTKQLGKSYYLTVEQYEDAIWASQILKEVDGIFASRKNEKRAKRGFYSSQFNLEKRNVKINKLGKIYVDTSILVQLIELHDTLGEIINTIQETPLEGNLLKDCSSTNIKYDLFRKSDDSSVDLNNFIFNSDKSDSGNSDKNRTKYSNVAFNTKIKKSSDLPKFRNILSQKISNSFTDLPQKKYCVMSAHSIKSEKSQNEEMEEKMSSKKNLSTLLEERSSNSEVQLSQSKQFTRKTKSTGSIKLNEKDVKVTDVAGARKIIVKCLSDLDKVRSYLELEKTDIGVTAEIQIQTMSGQETIRREPSNRLTNFDGHCCCNKECPADIPLEFMLDEREENTSKLIICIKGKNDDEGDVQIIIRQCPECKNLGEATEESENTMRLESTTVKNKGSKLNSEDTEYENFDNLLNKNYESSILHGKDHDNCSLSSDEHDREKSGINVIFNPEDPSNSIVESPRNINDEDETQEILNTESEKNIFEHSSDDKLSASNMLQEKNDYEMNQSSSYISPKNNRDELKADDCSRIKLYETTNLCFCTDNGQELIISLTIRPKTDEYVTRISLKDIFSESVGNINKNDESNVENTSDINVSQPNESNKIEQNEDLPTNNYRSNSRAASLKNKSSEHVKFNDDKIPDRVIPLSRTKICSSLEFDVTLVESNIRDKGIKHINPNIVVRLKEMGVNNLLRACRPVKCGRPAVLNEKLRKCLPYSASLTSLPLEEADTDIIDQSLNMTLTKSKHSTTVVREKLNKTVYYVLLSENYFQTELNYLFSKAKRTDISLERTPKVEFNTFQNKNTVKANSIHKKLSFYINLVNDITDSLNSKIFDVRFFEIERYNGELSRKFINSAEPKQLHTFNSQTKEIDGGQVQKMSGKKQISVVQINSELNLNAQSSTCKIENRGEAEYSLKNWKNFNSSQLQLNTNLENIKKENQKLAFVSSSRKFISKIPVYKFNRRKYLHQKLSFTSDVYDISLHSLPRDDSSTNEGSLHVNTSRPKMNVINSFKDNDVIKFSSHISKRNINNLVVTSQIKVHEESSSDSLETCFYKFFRETNLSKDSLFKRESSLKLNRRRKKSEFCLSRSRSEIFHGDLKNITNSSLEKGENSSNIIENKNKCIDCSTETSKSLIDFFAKLFFEYMITNMFLEKKSSVLEGIRSTKVLLHPEITTNDSAVKDNIIYPASKRYQKVLSQPNVEAGMEVGDLLLDTPTKRAISSKKISIKENIRFKYPKNKKMMEFSKTKTKFSTLKYSKTLLSAMDYGVCESCKISNGTFTVMENCKKSTETILLGRNNSCNQIDNFMVIFKSSSSITCNKKKSLEDYVSINESILKNNVAKKDRLFEKNKYDAYMKGLKNDPFQYLVYQNFIRCPSFVEKIFRKSNSRKSRNFNKTSQDLENISVKYRNNKEIHKMQSTEDYGYLCKKCGCYIPGCFSHKNLDLTNYCSCPNENKLGILKEKSKAPHKSQMKSAVYNDQSNRLTKRKDKCKICGCNILECSQNLESGIKGNCSCPKKNNIRKESRSKWTTPTMSCFRKSRSSCKLFSGKNYALRDKINPKFCLCPNKKSVGIICFPENIQIGICANLSNETQANSVSKCYCDKCIKFAEDGSCYCSHCLGLFDKSVETKFPNNNVGTQCECCTLKSKNKYDQHFLLEEKRLLDSSNKNANPLNYTLNKHIKTETLKKEAKEFKLENESTTDKRFSYFDPHESAPAAAIKKEPYLEYDIKKEPLYEPDFQTHDSEKGTKIKKEPYLEYDIKKEPFYDPEFDETKGEAEKMEKSLLQSNILKETNEEVGKSSEPIDSSEINSATKDSVNENNLEKSIPFEKDRKIQSSETVSSENENISEGNNESESNLFQEKPTYFLTLTRGNMLKFYNFPEY